MGTAFYLGLEHLSGQLGCPCMHAWKRNPENVGRSLSNSAMHVYHLDKVKEKM